MKVRVINMFSVEDSDELKEESTNQPHFFSNHVVCILNHNTHAAKHPGALVHVQGSTFSRSSQVERPMLRSHLWGSCCLWSEQLEVPRERAGTPSLLWQEHHNSCLVSQDLGFPTYETEDDLYPVPL